MHPAKSDFLGGGKKGTGTFNTFPRTTKLLAGGSNPNVCFREGNLTEGCLLLFHFRGSRNTRLQHRQVAVLTENGSI